VIDQATALFTEHGFTVARNAPFAGGFITQHYGRPSRNMHALQIEIDRALYMDERTLSENDGFDALEARLSAVIAGLSQIGGVAMPMAAE
jgi:N-formylglutamate deformylase